ncbi:synaptic vesicular amine transporter-like [Nelusetta ayraudi]|uniref:synaptic vesicular amine transporter-like n=1 Tax=Nelusetta ayraudi TaxID=303726 RepID=UPI003F725008
MDFLAWLRNEARMKKMVLAIVSIAMFLDNMLLTVVVPILPNYLYKIDHANVTETNREFPGETANTSESPPVSTPGHTGNSSESDCSRGDPELDDINVKLGLLLASKSTMQLIVNPFIGRLTDRVGYHWPMCAGFCIMIISTTFFAFSSSYFSLLLARTMQGVGGSCVSVAGFGMLADAYKDEMERGRAIGIAFSGLALGVIAGPPFGSVMYQFVGMRPPFIVLTVVAVLGGGLHFLIFKPSRMQQEVVKGTPLLTLLRDPYILIAAGALCFTTLVIAILEAALPLWMMETMCASKWQLGVVFTPDSVSYLIASNIFGYLSQKHQRSWLCAFIGMILTGITSICYGFSTNIYHAAALNAVVGFSLGIVDSSIMPLMGNLVDQRYEPVYGTVYAIADVAVCTGFCVGPAISGPIMASIGFFWLMVIIGTLNIIFAPLCIFLCHPLHREKHLIKHEGQ